MVTENELQSKLDHLLNSNIELIKSQATVHNAYIYALFDDEIVNFDEVLFKVDRLAKDYDTFEQTINFRHSENVSHQNGLSRKSLVSKIGTTTMP